MNSEPPRMAQFTVISGRKIPKRVVKRRENLSSTISRICTIAAITPI